MQSLHDRARARRRRVLLPEADDPRTRAAARTLEQHGLCEPLLVEQPRQDPRFERVVEHVFARRRAKGLDRDGAAALASQPLYFAAALVGLGEADASVAGATHATAEVIRAGLYCVGTAPGIDVVSSMFLMVRGEAVYSFADCGVIPEPDPRQLAAIAAATVDNHLLLAGTPPRVAFLSFSTKGSATHPKVDKVCAGLSAFRALRPDVPADGELQFDAAVVPEIAERKAPGSPAAGAANVFVFPDLDAGNIAYKITERLGGFQAFGPLIQGLARPCLDLSRGCSADDIVHVAVIASVMAGRARSAD
ncbi:MAG: phosphotransacetylase [Planctomycetes bacterium]|nr:phosphotransacetylase [Planctomycetota bacterium]MCB9887927.1 phosphotransacetylase [Planctomycetota bacterium]